MQQEITLEDEQINENYARLQKQKVLMRTLFTKSCDHFLLAQVFRAFKQHHRDERIKKRIMNFAKNKIHRRR